MIKRVFAVLAVCMVAGAAQAQMGGGHGHGGGGRGRHSQGDSSAAPVSAPAPITRATPVNQVDIVGVIQAIGPEPDRVTIAYQAAEGLNLPAGTMPFVVSKMALLKGATVGEKVRFRLESHQISALSAY